MKVFVGDATDETMQDSSEHIMGLLCMCHRR